MAGSLVQLDGVDVAQADGWNWSYIGLGNDDGTGVLNLSGDTNLALNGRLNLGRQGEGTVNQTGGSLSAPTIAIGDDGFDTDFDGGIGTYNMSGGTLEMNGGGIFFDEGVGSFTFDGGVLRNAGTVGFDLLNSGGTIQPGASPGVTIIRGDYTQGADATYDAEIAGTMADQIDLLDIRNMAALDGTLNVSLLDGFVPSLGDTFDVLTAGDGVSGMFSSTVFDSIGGGLDWQVNYLANSVQLEVIEGMGMMCIAGDTAPCTGSVNIDDLNAVRNNFGTGDGSDTSGIPGDAFPFDGFVNIDDLNGVRNNFGNMAAAVPEPGSLALLAGALLFAIRAVRRNRRQGKS